MSIETITMKEGDVFRWNYRDQLDDGAWGRYHCCSRIAIVRNGRLRDTFWMIGDSFASDGRQFSADSLHKLDLTYLGNLAGLEKKPEYEADYFDDADIVDLNHSNSSRGNFYLRKGAKRSQTKMIEVAMQKLKEAQYEQSKASRRAENLMASIARIEAGEVGLYL